MQDEQTRSPEEIRAMVRDAYAERARTATSCCGPSAAAEGAVPTTSCCGPSAAKAEAGPDARTIASAIGYSPEQIESVPEGANLGLGCGNPTALAQLRPGEIVLDLGAGAGFDALLAADAVGKEGRVIGVDMTPEMLGRARSNAVKAGVADRVEFREGILEELPVVSESVDVVISNCVVNLSPDKPRAFREAFRVLKPGGRLAVSDIVLSAPLPPAIARAAEAWVGCVAGAMLESEYVAAIEAAGFTDVRVSRSGWGEVLKQWTDDPRWAAAAGAFGPEVVDRAAESVWSLRVEARKPETRSA